VKDVKGTLYLLWGGALFVLLIGAVNIANLVLARSSVRMKEMATRFALGAGRGRVARQMVTESLLLTFCSALIGLLLGWWGRASFRYWDSTRFPGKRDRDGRRGGRLHPRADDRVGTGIGLIPVVHLHRADLNLLFRSEGAPAPADRVRGFCATRSS